MVGLYPAAPAGIPFAVNFRATAGFVADGLGAVDCVMDVYPRVDFATYGWTSAPNSAADRDNTNIPPLAGINYVNNGGPVGVFRIDLAALGGPGTYAIGCALGDATAAQGIQKAVFKDAGGATLFTVNGTQTIANHFVDAAGVELANTAWLAGQTVQSVAIAGSFLEVTIGNAASGYTCLASLSISRTGS